MPCRGKTHARRFIHTRALLLCEAGADGPAWNVADDGTFEARLITLACSDAPEGYRRWAIKLLADKVVELRFAESVSHMTVQRVLKKRTPHRLLKNSFI